MARNTQNSTANPSEIKQHILLLRGRRVIIDTDLARLYGATTKRLNEQVKRNRVRFPDDFMLILTKHEKDQVVANCDHLAKLKYSSTLPQAFTEYGAVMAANILNSQLAIEASVLVVRAFIHTREIIAEHASLQERLDELEKKITSKFADHEDELQDIRFAIQQLMIPNEKSTKSPIGFRTKNEIQ